MDAMVMLRNPDNDNAQEISLKGAKSLLEKGLISKGDDGVYIMSKKLMFMMKGVCLGENVA